MSDMAAEISPPSTTLPPGTVLRIVTQVFLVTLGVALVANFFTDNLAALATAKFFTSGGNFDNILHYVHPYMDEQHASFSPTTTVIHILFRAYVLFSAVVMIGAGARLWARSWHLAAFAQVAAIINAFGVIALWGFNTYAIAEMNLAVDIPTGPLLAALAFLLANILTACMLSGVIGRKKDNARAAQSHVLEPHETGDVRRHWQRVESFYVFLAVIYGIAVAIMFQIGMVQQDQQILDQEWIDVLWLIYSLAAVGAAILTAAFACAAWNARHESLLAAHFTRWLSLIGLAFSTAFAMVNLWTVVHGWFNARVEPLGFWGTVATLVFLASAAICGLTIWASGRALRATGDKGLVSADYPS